MTKKLKVLHAPTLVGGNPIRLAEAEEKLGLNSYCLSVGANTYGYHAHEVLDNKNRWIALFRVLFWSLFKARYFDVIHFNFGSTLMPARPLGLSKKKSILSRFKLSVYKRLEFFDLKLWSRSKVIAVTFQGDDARQGAYCRSTFKIHFAHLVDESYYSAVQDAWKRERIALFDHYADLIYAVNPDLLRVLPSRSKFLPYSGVDLNKWLVVHPQQGNDFIPNVIHAPSHQLVKGSKYILDAVRRLRSEGIQFNFTLIEGLTHDEAMVEYQKADLLIDQLLAGFYGGLSMELMTLGKPCICYIREEDMVFLPAEMRKDMPILNAEPDSIYEVLKLWITSNKHLLRQQGEKSRRYIEKWHDPLKVAAIVKADYEQALIKKKKSRI